MTYSELYNEGRDFLNSADITEAALDSRLLLEFVCGADRNTLYAHPDRIVTAMEEENYRKLLAKRAEHIPLQHLVGECDFCGLTFKVNGNVLIPRQDTEILAEEAMRYIEDGMKVLDMCTGSGCIILSLVNYKNNLEAVGVDISERALAVARENAERLNSLDRGNITFLQGDLYEALAGCKDRFDVIVSNPPYIRDDVIKTLSPEVKDHDPYIALSGGKDGLDFYRRIIKKAPDFLSSEGKIFLEIGYDQSESVTALLREAGFKNIETIKDYAGLDRVVKAGI